MFNLKKYKVAIDLSQKIKPEQIPGRTLDEKVAYISEYLDRSIGEKFANGEITENQVYKLLSDKKIESEKEFAFLEQYRANITSLMKVADSLVRSEGETRPRSQVINSLLDKLLQRTQTVFIPQLVKLHRVTSRTYELVEPLLQYEKPEEIAAIRKFIAQEVFERREEIRLDFLSIFQGLGLTIEQMCYIYDGNDEEIAKLNLSPAQLMSINDKLKTLKQAVLNMSTNQRIWNRILELYVDIPDREKWSSLIPEDLRITWRLDSILRYYDFPITRAPKEISSRPRGKEKTVQSLYYYFYPETDDNGQPFTDDDKKRQYALKKLKECVLNGYEDEKIFDAIGVGRVVKGPSQVGRKKKTETIADFETAQSPEDVEIEEESNTEIVENPSVEEDSDFAKIRFWYKNLVKVETGKVAVSATTQLSAFRKDLREAGLFATAEILGQAYEKAEDKRYQEFDLKFLSAEEMNICNVLRNDYNLDPIPFPVKIPCPTDNPTSSRRFEIDFLLPCEVLVGFEIVEGINKTTGEITFIEQPIIEHRVMFIGEYFGIRWTTEHPIEDEGKPWVTPSGNVPIFDYASPTAKIKKVIISPGQYCRDLEFYKLKSAWKIFTTEIIGDLIGTRTLSFDRQDLVYTSRLMKKLDAQGIIYKHKDCDNKKNTCWAYKQIIERTNNIEDYDMFFNDDKIRERFESNYERSLNILDCAIINVLLSEALFTAKETFVSSNNTGFNRQTMREHQQIYGTIDSNVEYLQSIGFKNEQNIRGMRQFEKMLAESSAKTRKQEQFDRANEMRQEMKNFSNSPLKNFKDYFDKVSSEGVIGEKIKNLRELRKLIEEKKISPSFNELRSMIQVISPDIIGQLMERGEGED